MHVDYAKPYNTSVEMRSSYSNTSGVYDSKQVYELKQEKMEKYQACGGAMSCPTAHIVP